MVSTLLWPAVIVVIVKCSVAMPTQAGDGGHVLNLDSNESVPEMGTKDVELVVQKNPILEEHMGEKYSPKSTAQRDASKSEKAGSASTSNVIAHLGNIAVVLLVICTIVIPIAVVYSDSGSTPTPSPGAYTTTVTQAVTFDFSSLRRDVSRYTDDVQTSYEQGYGKLLGIYDAAFVLASGCSIRSTATSGVSNEITVTFTSRVSASTIISTVSDRSALQQAIEDAATANGLTISVSVLSIAVATLTTETRYGWSDPAASCVSYCKPGDSCWPGTAQWKADLGDKLGSLDDLFAMPTSAAVAEEFYNTYCILNLTRFYDHYGTTMAAESCVLSDLPNYPRDSNPGCINCSSSPAEYIAGWSYAASTDALGPYGPAAAGLQQPPGWQFIQMTFPWQRMYGAHGVCNQNPGGQYVDGDASSGMNTAAYIVAARSVADIQAALAFAQKYNIQVTIKNTGHSYHSGSTGRGSLNIWTANFPKWGNVSTDWKNSCGLPVQQLYTIEGSSEVFGWDGETPVVALKIGSGQPFREIYDAAFQAGYYVAGGTNPGVGGGGGWLFGGGIAFTSRHLGYGIDNAVEFEVVLANGSHVVADQCSNTDIYWAFRGGGGGSFGVATSVTYRLWEDKPILETSLQQLRDVCTMIPEVGSLSIAGMTSTPFTDHDFSSCGTLPSTAVDWVSNLTASGTTCIKLKFIHLCGTWGDFVIDNIYASIDDRWGNNAATTIQFRGSLADAKATLFDAIDTLWEFPGNESIVNAFGSSIKYTTWQYDSYHDYRLRCGLASFWGPPLANYTVARSTACAGTDSPGKCLQKIINDTQGIANAMDGHTDGYLWANYIVEGSTAGYEGTSTSGCSFVLDVTNETVRSQLKSVTPLTPTLLDPRSYMVGGRLSKVPDDATAIGPQQRNGQLYMPFGVRLCPTVKTIEPFTTAGAGYNHYGQWNGETDFDAIAWGSNVPRLQAIKLDVDPDHRLNAKHTFGYLKVCNSTS